MDFYKADYFSSRDITLGSPKCYKRLPLGLLKQEFQRLIVLLSPKQHCKNTEGVISTNQQTLAY